MRAKRLFCIVLSLILCLTLCTPALAEGDLLFVAVNDSIPLTLTALPYESSSGIYVPYTAFDASPGGVIPAYNAQAQTFVLFTRQRRLVFDLAEGTVTDQDGNVKTVSTTFRGGMLYVPLVYCASFFSLKVSLLQSTSGYPILRFTTGSEVYDDSLFVEKAESLIQYRIDQMNTPEPSQPQTPAQHEPDKPEQPEPEPMPATVYLAFTNAETMADNAALLEMSNLRGTFFLTAAELTADPALARKLYAAGHILGVTVTEDCENVSASLLEANDALCRALNTKTLFALLPAWQQDGITDFSVLTSPQEPVSAEFAVQQTNVPQLLIVSQDAAQTLSTLAAAGANIELLRETTKLS